MAQEQAVLPKGIVLNRTAVYEEIAKYDIIPVELILRSSRVFSTTSNKLYDPTARRLENFWTRVLGGDRRYLSGRSLSQLFKDISEERSFVKLRGPHNRYEPPSPESQASGSRGAQATPLIPVLKPKHEPTTSPAKIPHPILKKPRGPSHSGPRPTARFVSPPESDIDDDRSRQNENTAQPAAVTSGSKSKDPGSSANKEERRKGQPPKSRKKTTAFVASTARQRPRMPRRSSSQSSTGASDIVPKETDSSVGSKFDGSQSSVPTIPEKPEPQQSSTKKGKEKTGLSAKVAGKRPMTQSRTEKATLKFGTTQISQDQIEAFPTEQDSTEVEQQSTVQPRLGRKAAGSTENPPPASSPVAPRKHGTPNRPGSESSPLMIRSSSDAGPARPASREVSRSFVPPSSLMASTLAKLDTSVIGTGTITGYGVSMPTPDTIGQFGQTGLNAAHEAVARNARAPTLAFTGQMAPTEPGNAVSIPLGRTKSQLSLLLERNDRKSKR